MNYLFLTEFRYTLFTKTLLLFRISLLKRSILEQLDFPWCNNSATLTKNQVKAISIYFIRKTFPSSKVIYCLPSRKIQPQEKSCLPDWFRIFHMLLEETLPPTMYVTEWTFCLIFVEIFSKLSSINDYFQIPTFLINEHCSRQILGSLKTLLSQYHQVFPHL